MLINIDNKYYITDRQLGAGAQGEVYVGAQVDIDGDPIGFSSQDIAIKFGDLSEQGFGSKLTIEYNRERAIKQNEINGPSEKTDSASL